MLKFTPTVDSYKDGAYYATFEIDNDVTVCLLNETEFGGTICDITNDAIIIDIDYPRKDYRSFSFEKIDYLDWF